MKQLTCEMCGCTDLLKQDGVFVCQSCGCKYSVEEARKMMIEGTVDVSGSTIKVDNSDFVQKYLANARRAKEKTDWEEVEKYYNMVEQYEPQNIEAIFYSAYGKVMLSLTDADRFKRQQKFDVFGKSISIIDDHYDVQKKHELIPIIKAMSNDLISLTQSNYVYNYSTNTNDAHYTKDMMLAVELKFVESIENIVQKDADVEIYTVLRIHYERLIKKDGLMERIKEELIEKLEKCYEEINQLDPSYLPEVNFVKNYRYEKEQNDEITAKLAIIGTVSIIILGGLGLALLLILGS